MSDKKYCYFDITIGGVPCAERVVMELFDDVAPKTCENFRKLCLGNDGKTVDGSNIPMTYKGVTFHRVIAGFMIQSGDYTAHDGTGGVSIYGEKFDDEDFTVPCDKAGLLAMANAGPNTNGSQFFITVAPAPHLTGRHVVFGKVVRGMNTVRRVEHTPTVANDRPADPCVVADCGVMDALPDVPVATDGDKFPDFAEDCDPQLDDLQLIEAGESVRQIGNDYFKKGMFAEAIDKYKKAVRYLEHTTGKENAIDDKLLACHNNTAACALRLSEWAHAIQAATSALQLDADNVKALFRRGSAAMETHDYESAIEDLSKAHKLDPTNAEVVAKLNQAKEKRKQSQEKYAARFQKMFS